MTVTFYDGYAFEQLVVLQAVGGADQRGAGERVDVGQTNTRHGLWGCKATKPV